MTMENARSAANYAFNIPLFEVILQNIFENLNKCILDILNIVVFEFLVKITKYLILTCEKSV